MQHSEAHLAPQAIMLPRHWPHSFETPCFRRMHDDAVGAKPMVFIAQSLLVPSRLASQPLPQAGTVAVRVALEFDAATVAEKLPRRDATLIVRFTGEEVVVFESKGFGTSASAGNRQTRIAKMVLGDTMALSTTHGKLTL